MSQIVRSQQLVSSLAVGELSGVAVPGKLNIIPKGDSPFVQQLEYLLRVIMNRLRIFMKEKIIWGCQLNDIKYNVQQYQF